jgi:hypothetical protein
VMWTSAASGMCRLHSSSGIGRRRGELLWPRMLLGVHWMSKGTGHAVSRIDIF